MGSGGEQGVAAALGQPGTALALLDGAAEAIVAVDGRGVILLANRRAEKVFGYSRAELLGREFGILLSKRIRADYMASWAACFARLETEEPLEVYEAVAVRKNGDEFPAEVRVSRVEGEHPPLVVALIQDITARRRVEAELSESRQELRALAGHLMTFGEEMRKQLARELHDALGQKLALVSLELDSLRQAETRAGIRERLEAVLRQVGEAAVDLQRLSRQLHPAVLFDLGLHAALESECELASRLHPIRAVCHCDPLPPLREDVSLALYRIAQEAIRNAARHSGADRVEVFVGSDGRWVKLRVQDRGRGFDAGAIRGKAGLGLVSIRERARLVDGEAKIDSAPGRGTAIKVRVPLHGKDDEAGA
jgi:PAS domain S-box-containing protein